MAMHPRSSQATAILALTLTTTAAIASLARGQYLLAALILTALAAGLATAITRWNRGATRGTFTPAAQMTHDERVQNRAEFERIIDSAGLRNLR